MFTQLIFKPVVVSTSSQCCVVGSSASRNALGAKYPRIFPDDRVIFPIDAPYAEKAQFDSGKKHDMVKGAAGLWEISTDSIGRGFHCYSLLIGDVAVVEPGNETFYGMGRRASGNKTPIKGEDYYAVKDVPHVQSRIKPYYSKVTNTWIQYHIYYTHPGVDTIQTKNIRYCICHIMDKETNGLGLHMAGVEE